MKVAIIAIGNSRGVRLPKAVLDQVDLRGEAELTVEDGRIVLAPAKARQGWAETFAAEPATHLDSEESAWLDASLDADGGRT